MHCMELADYTSAEPVTMNTYPRMLRSSYPTHCLAKISIFQHKIHLLNCGSKAVQVQHSSKRPNNALRLIKLKRELRNPAETKINKIPSVFVCCLYPRNCKHHQILKLQMLHGPAQDQHVYQLMILQRTPSSFWAY